MRTGLVIPDTLEIDGEPYPYAVSDQGRVMRTAPGRGTYPGRLLRTHALPTGYVYATLQEDRQTRRLYVHRLVLIAFAGDADESQQANHINGVKADNRLANLEWATPHENLSHAVATGLRQYQRGVRHHRSKLTNEQAQLVRRAFSEGQTKTELAREYGVAFNTIHSIVLNLTYTVASPGN